MKTPFRGLLPLLMVLSGMAAHAAMAQTYPVKPVRVVVPFPPGGTVDTVGRAMGQKYTEVWKQPVIVDNRPGAGGNIGADNVAKSAPDGYTLLLNVHGMAISPGLYKKLPFDPIRDFTPVSQLTSSFLVLVAHPKLAANNVKELIALARSQPGKLNYGSTGLGAPPHLAMEIFKSVTRTDIVHVPYKGDALQMPALLAGEVQIAFTPLPAASGHMKAGKLRDLGMTGTKRSGEIPGVPTMIEAGVPDFAITGWLGLFAPAGTPRDVVNRISAETARIVNQTDIRQRLPGWGYEPVGSTPEEFTAKYRQDIARYTKAIKDARVPQLD